MAGAARQGTSGTFAAFISSLPRITQTHVLLDNVSFHKSRVVQEAFAAKGLTPVYTPPYSPEYNPVEIAFSVFKAHVWPQPVGICANGLDDMCTRVRACAASLSKGKLAAMLRQVWELICAFAPREISSNALMSMVT